ncbi:MAG: bifunctional alpha,alpha-trehalose-phosphate synthase (UDP-forming)/trehalose-phosphatase [Bacillota bacterium]|nr:bifunctional alpha,alpha-trehalose-phosphate synthase (UDP-forming)/trehalose-phosphatase [Bacillota bacterium]MDW7678809.1 bifunctional alpha,alpha-trehalose-phosphate synthase (UDP-forming)/trehalose-phosphatase [Bacillota bacterium]
MSKLIIVSNRLPVTVARNEEAYEYQKSLGGLATGLKSYHEQAESLWIGWPGITSDDMGDQDEPVIRDKLHSAYGCLPVFLNAEELEHYYYGFCNNTLWPLFHYFTDKADFNANTWAAYRQVNEKFFHAVDEVMEEDDQVWVHDYQLMLLPGMIREKYPQARIGFFLHIPFPSSEIFRLLIWREEILEGVLGSDLIGFHTYDYVRHFLSSTRRLLGVDHHLNTLHYGDRSIRVDAFPMGIDYNKFHRDYTDREHLEEMRVIRESKKDQRLILSVDRLDYTKGIPERLRAFDTFLTLYPEYREKVKFMLIVAPSREAVSSYEELKREIEELVGSINGKHSTVDWVPVWFYFKPFSQKSLISFYRNADVLLVTPLRDGMNLVAKEYAASRRDHEGMIVISETAGAASELGEVIRVNPRDTAAIADGLRKALKMTPEEKQEINQIIHRRLKRYNVRFWAADFVTSLQKHERTSDLEQNIENIEQKAAGMIAGYRQAEKRLILLDYDGTLVGFTSLPQQARPDRSLKELLTALAANPYNTLAIVSGRDRNTLEKWLGDVPVHLVGSHGLWVKKHRQEWKMTVSLDSRWKPTILEVMQLYSDRMPGSFIEEKDYSIAFHYRKCDPDMAADKLSEIRDALLTMTQTMSLGIQEGNKVLEVKDVRINKGMGVTSLLNENHYDFILAAGDDKTDEDLFAILPSHAYTVKVGFGLTAAAYYVNDWTAVRSLLRQLEKSEDMGGIDR